MRRSTLLIALAAALLLAAAPTADAAKLGSRQLRTGSHGSDVKQLQRALRALGYKLSVDGAFGPQTGGVVRRYERARHMKVDGIVGSREARRILLEAAVATPPPGSPPPTGGSSPPTTPPAGSPPPSDPPRSGPPPSDPPPAPGAHVFPVLGPVSFGGAGARFGAPRAGHTHQGQDVLAAEGTQLVSVTAGTVHWRSYQASGAGNYVVIRADDGFDYVYMHMRETASVAPGAHVAAGQPIGHVGHTGAAEGPHLHFELWQGPWQAGGHPIDPLPYLQSWLAGLPGR
jgi:murein DD-endopeptidase MepM/ murein hydrolase activator NlpD